MLFEDLGFEVEKICAVESGLVIDRFDSRPGETFVRASICGTRADFEMTVELAA
ncbi:hypothetical protein [Amycolatopsis sp. lyj-346]|uniref:hypothetical protein n=1 Tax=Amycolatopsis sp. lyj-346 TaxID=2789289 RepID=UPI003979440B